jgi:hypothetical protein
VQIPNITRRRSCCQGSGLRAGRVTFEGRACACACLDGALLGKPSPPLPLASANSCGRVRSFDYAAKRRVLGRLFGVRLETLIPRWVLEPVGYRRVASVAFGPRHSCTRRFAEKGFSVPSQLPISTSSTCNDRVTVGKVFLSLKLLGGSTGRSVGRSVGR